MKEIDENFYCSAGLYRDGDCAECICGCQTCKIDCENYHRKWPTPEQFKKEYGGEWKGAYYNLFDGKWTVRDRLDWGKNVCASTPFGKPDNDWRPA